MTSTWYIDAGMSEPMHVIFFLLSSIRLYHIFRHYQYDSCNLFPNRLAIATGIGAAQYDPNKKDALSGGMIVRSNGLCLRVCVRTKRSREIT